MHVGSKRSLLAATAAAFAMLAAPGRLPAQSQPPASPMDKSYQLLIEKSIFSKDRRSASQGSTSRPTQPVRVLSPEQSVVFRGVLSPDDEYVAFVENVSTGQISIVKTGDELALGRVEAIPSLDTLRYAAGGKVREIHLGQNLAGEVASGAAGAVASGAPSTGPAGAGPVPGASPTPADPAQAAIIERLKQRKLQEGGR